MLRTCWKNFKVVQLVRCAIQILHNSRVATKSMATRRIDGPRGLFGGRRIASKGAFKNKEIRSAEQTTSQVRYNSRILRIERLWNWKDIDGRVAFQNSVHSLLGCFIFRKLYRDSSHVWVDICSSITWFARNRNVIGWWNIYLKRLPIFSLLNSLLLYLYICIYRYFLWQHIAHC